MSRFFIALVCLTVGWTGGILTVKRQRDAALNQTEQCLMVAEQIQHTTERCMEELNRCAGVLKEVLGEPSKQEASPSAKRRTVVGLSIGTRP